ncbi:MAG: gamma-glutamyl-gamma-aminobutyrate hydrolase family protein, partial [bacterium]
MKELREMTKRNKQPIIGITTYGRDKSGNFYLHGKYVDAVRKAGGLPILLPPGETHIEQILNVVNGIIFAGGGDIEPSLYGGPPHPTISRVDSERDAFELPLARRVLHEDIPVLGICRGFQVLNVAAGG